MKNKTILSLVIFLSFISSIAINAQIGKFEMTIKDSVRKEALRKYLGTLDFSTHLVKGKFIVVLREEEHSLKKDSLFNHCFSLYTTPTNYYKYSGNPLAGYFYLDGVLFIVELNSHFLKGSSGILDEIDKVVGNILEEYVPTRSVPAPEVIVNGKSIKVRQIYGDPKISNNREIVFYRNGKYQIYNLQ